MWSGTADFHPLLATYQALFREQEALIRQRCKKGQVSDDRHHFVLAIPVADRPPHLRACLESLYQVCTLFDYGGTTSGVWDKIQVIVAEDSRDEANVRRHIELVDEYRQKGLQVVHFGLAEQCDLLDALPPHTRERLGHLLTTQPRDRFYLKGQAANRNLSYLKFLQLTQDRDRTLYFLIDSDQSLCVNRQTASGEEVVYALPYFHAIDRIFRTTDTLMLTGKMVGDPPVSPSVMAANFSTTSPPSSPPGHPARRAGLPVPRRGTAGGRRRVSRHGEALRLRRPAGHLPLRLPADRRTRPHRLPE